jgi:hypothetical protein
VQLGVSASFGDGATLGTATSDATGHATLDVVLPSDLLVSPSLTVEAISARGIRRTFDAQIALDPPTIVELVVDRERAPPGGSIALLGRVRSAVDGHGEADAAVSIALHDASLVRAPLQIVTDAAGVFLERIVLPTRAGAFSIEATVGDVSGWARVETAETVEPSLWVRAAPARSIVRPGEDVSVDVFVREADGPVRGARVEWADHPTDDDDVIRTDDDGHATLHWRVDRLAAASGIEDLERTVSVVHAAHGTTEALASVRVARSEVVLTWSVEGGALTR